MANTNRHEEGASMKRLTRSQNVALAALLVLFLGASARAADVGTAPKPSETLALARKSRLDYIKAVADVQAFVPNMSTSDEIYGYILILDELEKIGQKYQLDTLGGSPLGDLAVLLTRNAIKWVRLDTDSEALQTTFFRWAEDSSRYTVAQQQSRFLFPLKEKRDLELWHVAIMRTIDLVTALKAEPYVIQAYDELQGSVVRKLLELRSQLTADEKSLLITKTKSVTALQEVLDFLTQEALQSKDIAYVKQTMGWTIALGNNLRSLKQSVPFGLKTAPGHILVDTIAKLLSNEEGPDASLVDEIMVNLAPSQITELSGFILQLYQDRPIPKPLVDFLFEITDRIMKKYVEMGLPEKLKELHKFSNRISMLKGFQDEGAEGTYRVTVGNNTGVLTIANIGSSNFILGLGMLFGDPDGQYEGQGTADFSLFNVTYNFRDASYEASHYAVDSAEYIPPNLQSFFCKFRLKKAPGGRFTIEGVFANGLGPMWKISGTQIETYPAFDKVPARDQLENVTGVYRGMAGDSDLQLTLTQAGQRISGTLSLSGFYANVHLTFSYFNRSRNVVYVTSGELDSGKWAQLRGQFSDEGRVFTGTFIIGGRGKLSAFTLRKIQ